MPDVLMPQLSDSMEEGTILKWLRGSGDEVATGDELVEIETDKATMTHEAELAGVLEVVAAEGTTLRVGELMARIGEGGDGAAAARAAEPDGAAEPQRDGAAEPPAPEPAAGAEPPAPEPAAAAEPRAPEPGDGVKASPIARRMARERGVDLASVRGSGPGGRIVKSDVAAAAGVPGAEGPVAAPSAAAPAPAPARPAAAAPRPGPGGTAKGDVTVQELTRLQQVVARRMAESKATVPDFTVAATADMEAAVALRAQLKALGGDGPVPSFNDLVVKAAGLALREFPRANASYRDGRFELYGRVNVGIAVAGQDALVVPTVFDADRKSVREIAVETRALAERVRAGVVTPPELSGGTFTVSNLGMYGMHRITPVINPPQAAILGVGELAARAVVRDGAVVARHVMDLTLVCDHRILYGAEAAEFLARLRTLLEHPVALVL